MTITKYVAPFVSRSSRPTLEGMLYGVAVASRVVLWVVPDNREISLNQYRWLAEQVEVDPEVRALIQEALADDGYISRSELSRLKKILTAQARESLQQALR